MQICKIKKNIFFNIFPIFNQCIYTKIKKGNILKKPIFFINFNNIDLKYNKNLLQNFVFLDKNTKCTIIDIYISTNYLKISQKIQTNHLHRTFILNNNSILYYIFLINLKNKYRNHYVVTGEQNEKSLFLVWSFILQGKKISIKINLFFIRKHIINKFLCITLSKSRDIYKLDIFPQHVSPQCNSNSIIKSIINDYSRILFLGKVKVYKYSNTSKGHLKFKTLLLSRDAKVESRPGLEIYNDDVICTHGFTVSYINKTLLYYIQSRGISYLTAQKLLLKSFSSFITYTIQYKAISSYIIKLIHGGKKYERQ